MKYEKTKTKKGVREGKERNNVQGKGTEEHWGLQMMK